jgi:hypothetical protein
MSITSRRRFLAVVLLAGLPLVLHCGDPGTPALPGAAPPAKGTTSHLTIEELRERATREIEAARKEGDEVARGLLKSFRDRVFDPVRDSGLESGAATVAVKDRGREASYRAVFDASKPEAEAVALEKTTEPADLSPAALQELRGLVNRWCHLTFRGASQYVVYYHPPVLLGLSRSEDGKRFVVHAPPFKTSLNVSWSFDERQLVTIQGEWTSEKGSDKAVTHYEWQDLRGRWLLRKASPPAAKAGDDPASPLFHAPTIDFDYDETDGLPLVRRVRLRQDERVLEAAVSYADLKLRPR